MKQKLLSAMIYIACFGLLSPNLFATNYSSILSVSNWSDAATWAGGNIPPATIGVNDTVFINNDVWMNINVVNNGTIQLNNDIESFIEVKSGKTLTNNGTIITETGSDGASMIVEGTLINTGTITFSNSGSAFEAFVGSTVTNTTTGKITASDFFFLIEGLFTNAGDMYFTATNQYNAIYETGELINTTGTMTFDASLFSVEGGTLTNNSSMIFNTYGGLLVYDSATIVNGATGTMELNDGCAFDFYGSGSASITNSGLITLDVLATLSIWFTTVLNNTATGTIINNGYFNNKATFNNNGTFTKTDSYYYGTGTYSNSVFINPIGSTVGFTGDIDCLTFSDGFTNNGIVDFDLWHSGMAPVACTDYDRITVVGTATLAGTAQISMYQGLEPQIGDEFIVLTATSIVDTFANNRIDLLNGTTAVISYTSTEVKISIVPTTLPGSYMYYVNSSATGANTGLSWADAFTDLQSALANIYVTGTIWVAEGTYTPASTDMLASFSIPSTVSVYGGFPNTGNPDITNRNPAIYPTILSGDIGVANDTSDNSYHVVRFIHADPSTTLDGFTIIDGHAKGFDHDRSGSAIYNDGAGFGNSSNPIIQNCIIRDNHCMPTYDGGAIFNNAENEGNASPTILNTLFENNSAAVGGAILNYTANGGVCAPSITNCDFINNYAAFYGGAMSNNGIEGVSNPIITNCVFANNVAGLGGGAVMNDGSYEDIYVSSSTPLFENCIFTNNSTNGQGGAMYSDASDGNVTISLHNCVVYGNSAGTEGGAFYNFNNANGNFDAFIFNSILWNNNTPTNANASIFEVSNVANVTYSIVQGATVLTGVGNSNANPDFYAISDPNGADDIWRTADDGLRLSCNSPAYDAGSVLGGPVLDILGNAVFGTTKDIGAYEAQYNLISTVAPTITTSGTTVCMGASVTLTAPAATKYAWYRNGVFMQWSTSPTLVFNALPGTNNYYVYVTYVGQDCPSPASNTITITAINPVASITPSFAPPYCLNKVPVLSAIPPTGSGYTYSWTCPTCSTTTNSPTLTPTAQNGNYSVTVTDGNGCSKTSNVLNVVLNAVPSVNAGADFSTCISFPVPLGNTNTTTGFNYQWTPSTNLSSATVGKPNVTPTSTTPITYTLRVTRTSTGCFAEDDVRVTGITQPAPTTLATSSTAALCQPSSITLTPGVVNNVFWYKNGAIMSNTPSSGARTFFSSALNGDIYTVRNFDGTCKSNESNPITLTIKAAPAPTLTSTPAIIPVSGSFVASICNQQTTGTAALVANIPSGAPAVTNYNWQQNISGTNTNLSPAVTTSNYTASVAASPAAQNNKSFRVQATYANGCTNSSINVFVRLQPLGCTARMNGEVEENLAESFTVYPNPTENSLNISLANFATETGDLILYNTLGQVILSESISLSAGKAEQSWDLSALSPGIYNLVFQTEKGQSVQKIVKE